MDLAQLSLTSRDPTAGFEHIELPPSVRSVGRKNQRDARVQEVFKLSNVQELLYLPMFLSDTLFIKLLRQRRCCF